MTARDTPRHKLRHTCGRCGVLWTGETIAHCGGCHRTFSGTSAFDEHRKRDTCVPPAELINASGPKKGLSRLIQRDGIWTHPEMTAAERQRRGFRR